MITDPEGKHFVVFPKIKNTIHPNNAKIEGVWINEGETIKYDIRVKDGEEVLFGFKVVPIVGRNRTESGSDS